jgi:competence protein ComEC
MQLAVTVALVPLTIALFAQLSLISPVANAISIPLVSLVVTPLALAAAVFVAMPEPLASIAVPLLAFAHGLFVLLADLLHVFVRLPAAAVPWPAPPAWALLSALLGVGWLLAPRGWPLRWVGILWLLPMAVWPPPRPAHDELWVTAIDVGQGTAVLIETHDAAMLFDTGPRYTPQSDAGSRIIAPYLRRRGIDRLDLMVVSHLDSDHSGGAESLMKEVAVERLLTSIEPASPVIRGARRTERCEHGTRGPLGPATWFVLQPAADDYSRRLDTNSMSCVIAVEFGEHRVLLTGDVPAAREEQILAREPAGALAPTTLLIAAHHGSRTSSGEAWVRAVRPHWVAYTMGYRNRFGHPHPEVVQRFADAGAKPVRTDESGTTTWRLGRGSAGTVTRSRAEQARYWHNRPGAVPETIGTDVVRDDGAETAIREPATPEPY